MRKKETNGSRTQYPAALITAGDACSGDREQVRRLRMGGMKCGQIARETGLTEERVKNFCRELGLPEQGSCRLKELSEEEAAWIEAGMQGAPANRLCPHCGFAVMQPRRGRQRRFCSDACRSAYWNDRRLAQPPRSRTVMQAMRTELSDV